MPLPPILRLEVEPSWVLRLLAAWVLLWAATLSVLALRRDLGPYPGPSAGSARNLHHAVTAIRDAQALLAAGDTAGAAARAQAALDQAPASAPARRVLAEARQAAGSSGGGEDMVAALVSEGLELLDRGLARRAADRFQQALALDPESSSARTYLAQAQAAAATSPQPARRTSSPAAAGATPLPDQAAPARLPPAPTPGTARITVFFNSPINAGSLEVTLDGTSLSEIPFDFTRKGMLGIKRKGSGQVKRVLLVPAGRHVVGISLEEAEKGSLGEASFTEVLPAGTDWTLRVDLPEGAPQAGFFLVRAAGG